MVNDRGETVADVLLTDSLPNGPNLTLSLPKPEELPPSLNADEVVSVVISATLVNPDGQIVPLEESAEICIGSNSEVPIVRQCLGFLDETQSPAEWKCQDKCLKKKKRDGVALLCGSTTHFTNFALLLSGSGKGKGPCDSSSAERYILGSFNYDLALVLSTSGFIWILLCCIVLFIRFALGSRALYGPEGSRIRHTRSASYSFQIEVEFDQEYSRGESGPVL